MFKALQSGWIIRSCSQTIKAISLHNYATDIGCGVTNGVAETTSNRAFIELCDRKHFSETDPIHKSKRFSLFLRTKALFEVPQE